MVVCFSVALMVGVVKRIGVKLLAHVLTAPFCGDTMLIDSFYEKWMIDDAAGVW